MRNPMLRGNSAPTGFAASVSGYLRLYVYKARHEGGGLTISQRERIDRIDACASLPVAVGDDDPRIRALALACPGGRWEPAADQRAVIDGAGHNVIGETVTLSPDELLNALSHAAMLDVATEHHRELSKVKAGTEAAPTHQALLEFERTRADQAEEQLRQMVAERETAARYHAQDKARLRELRQVLEEGGLIAREPVSEKPADREPRLPEGVRPKGSGYQAYFKVGGKQHSKILPTVDEAVRWRRDTMDRATAEQAARDANGPGPHYEPDVSPEERAAMQEAATA